jgi:HSP20 family protein
MAHGVALEYSLTFSGYKTMKTMNTAFKNSIVRHADLLSPFFTGSFRSDATHEADHFIPAADIYRSEAGIEILMSMPGLSKDEVHLNLEGNVLTISGERKRQGGTEQEEILRREIRYGSFRRSFTLNDDKLDKGAIEARMEHGVLRLFVPFSAKHQPVQIEIR